MKTQRELQETAEVLVRNEVQCCLSGIVSTLAAGADGVIQHRGGGNPHLSSLKDLASLCDQAFELACPVDDWEEAATQAGWTGPYKDKFGATYFENKTESEPNMTWTAKDWESLCRDFEDIEPYQREVFEHWAVSDRLADDLIELGEKVDKDFAGLCVWARTTTGQMIAMDAIMTDVARLLDKRVSEL